MPRFILLIKELGKAPGVVPLTGSVVIGRSRRADVVIDDEEVGREQFRLHLTGGGIEIEGIGQTNRTLLEGAKIDAGQRANLANGATIKVGRSSFTVQWTDEAGATAAGPVRADPIDATLVAPRPTRPAAPPPEQEQTGGASPPMGTMQFARPGSPTPSAKGPVGTPPAPPPAKPPTVADEPFGMTMPPKAGYRPGQAAQPAPTPVPPTPPAKPPAPPAADAAASAFEANMTMPLRPGRPQDEPPPNLTMPVARPGSRDAAPPPPPPAAAKPTPPPTPPPPPPTPPAPPPRPATPKVEPAPAAAAMAQGNSGVPKPKTVLVRAVDLPPTAATGGLSAAELEGRLHQCMPRLVVKGDGLKRRIRLLKLRTRVGRAETADVLLPNESVSEQHAEIHFDGTTWSLVDTGSTNGSLADGSLLRAAGQPIRRHALLGFGNLRAIFLCNDTADANEHRRHEERALHHLVRNGRLGRMIGKQALQLLRQDQSQSLAEVLLMDTPLEPADWSLAITATRDQLGLFARIRRYFARVTGRDTKR